MDENLTKDKHTSHIDALVMPCWKKCPHLFANGKFRVIYNKAYKKDYVFKMWGSRYSSEILIDPSINRYANVQDCTLIARPITDLSIQEVYELFYGSEHEANMTEGAANLLRQQINLYDTFQVLRLLDFGVYPFDQKHFETGEIIAKEA